ncbi:hypothetical protein LWF01_05930 [Saxibacter everestensis]|uniref:Cell division protein FtsL n=1 Tax=Saxibacter everestensis TaxID=2909229 RepID=A0ABY8QWA6_9MICO|nr:hypothetical protein LWF01_05930 [Brevibacteriaceae bacterium ZFBP1038]
MSQATARVTAPRRRLIPPADTAPPRLRLVAPPLPKRRLPFVLLCVGSLTLGLVAVLLLNIAVSHNSYRISELTSRQTSLAEQEDALTEDLSYRSSPQNLAKAATDLGMVADPNPLFLRLSDGKVMGEDELPLGDKAAGVTIPGPAAKTREASRPNLKTGKPLPQIGEKPPVAEPKTEATEELPNGQVRAPSQKAPDSNRNGE